MFYTTAAAAARPLLNPPTTTHFTPRRNFLHRRRSLYTTQIKMSSQIIEHIVLFNAKPSTTQSQLTHMLNGLNGLKSLGVVLHLTAGPIHRNRSTALNLTHMLHSRYRTKDDLAYYTDHPAHLDVVRGSVLPICDDIMAVDWVVSNLDGPVVVRPGSAMRVKLVKLKDGLGEKEKGEVLGVIGGLKEKVDGIEHVSFGENFSPVRAKGFSICSIGLFSGVNELEKMEEHVEIDVEKDKVRDYIDGLVVVDYVVPSVQSASL